MQVEQLQGCKSELLEADSSFSFHKLPYTHLPETVCNLPQDLVLKTFGQSLSMRKNTGFT